MRLSVISIFAAAVLAAPFVSAQTVQPAAGDTPQPVSAATGATAAAVTRTASTGTRRDIVSYVEELAGNTADTTPPCYSRR